MRIYILDDDINIVKMLQNIVELDFNRSVVGYQIDPEQAIDEIIKLRPDAVLIDYLMPEMDGLDVIRKVKSILPNIEFIMLSQVSDKDMIGEAYLEGISFFISKPLNKIEINVVLNNLADRIDAAQKLQQIMSLVGEPVQPKVTNHKKSKQAKTILRDLGIYSEKGSKDMLGIIEIMDIEHLTDYSSAFNHYCIKIEEKGKSVRQRMRRAAAKSLKNLCYLGIEDYLNETFVKYSTTMFNFKTVKLEMDFLRGKNIKRGSLSIDRFMENLCDFKDS